MALPIGKINTTWGIEIIWSNNEKYCGKILVFEKKGATTPLIFHKEMKKSWFVNAGRFKVNYIDIKTGKPISSIVDEGKTVDLSTLSPHQLEALEDNSIIFEVGTTYTNEDVYKLTPDQSKESSEEPAQDPQSSHHHGTESERT